MRVIGNTDRYGVPGNILIFAQGQDIQRRLGNFTAGVIVKENIAGLLLYLGVTGAYGFYMAACRQQFFVFAEIGQRFGKKNKTFFSHVFKRRRFPGRLKESVLFKKLRVTQRQRKEVAGKTAVITGKGLYSLRCGVLFNLGDGQAGSLPEPRAQLGQHFRKPSGK